MRRALDHTARTDSRPHARPQAVEVVHVITGLGNGGAEGALFRLCTHPNNPPSMVVSLMDEGVHGERLRAAGIEVECLGMLRGRFRLRAMIRLVRILRRARPKVVQTWMYHADLLGGIAARLSGINRVFWGIRSTRLPREGSARIIARVCSRLSHLVPRAIVCCADSAAQEHARMGYDANRMTTIGNGFDFSVLHPDPRKRESFRSTWGIGADEPLLGFVARFDPQKDHANLLRALALLRKSRPCPTVLLVGPGMDASNTELSAMIASEGLQSEIKLVGPQSDISAVMNALDLHVMSSRSEGFPNVLVEAMACGCPCISTDVGAARLIIGDTGWLVPPHDSDALAQALAQALDELSGARWSDRRNAARSRVADHFGLDKMVAQYRKLWQL